MPRPEPEVVGYEILRRGFGRELLKGEDGAVWSVDGEGVMCVKAPRWLGAVVRRLKNGEVA